MATRFEEFFSDGKRIMLLDGATGTELMKRGLKPRECGENWNLQRPEEIKRLAQMYYDAGSDAVLTNTFLANAIDLRRHGLEKQVYEINKAGAELTRAACPKGKFVIGCIGPINGFLKPIGELTTKEVFKTYAEQVRGLLDGGVDAISLETFQDLNIMECATNAIKNNANKPDTNFPYLCCMSFSKTRSGYRTITGVSVLEANVVLSKQGAFAVGSNCGNGIVNMVEIVREIRAFSKDVRIILEPNAGSPRNVNGRDVYDETPEFFRSYLPRLLEYRPSFLGGCCGTTPEHIKVMREFLDRDR